MSCNLSQIEKVTVFMTECKRMGLSVLAPDVNESDDDFTVNHKGDIRFGWPESRELARLPYTRYPGTEC